MNKQVDPQLEFYSGKQVLIFGGAGFVGAHLSKLLADAGAHVMVWDNFLHQSSEMLAHKRMRYRISDINDLDQSPIEADYTFALAAHVAGVLHNQRNHYEMYWQNMKVQASMIDYVRRGKFRSKFLCVSSVCVYDPEKQRFALEENGFWGTPHKANAGYSEAKRDFERMLEFCDDLPYVVVRPSNVAGAGDHYGPKSHVIPALIERAAKAPAGGELKIYGDPYVVREFIDVRDAAHGMAYALAYGDWGDVFNLGTNGKNVINMLNLAEMIVEELGRGDLTITHTDRVASSGDPYRSSNTDRLNDLGWRHKYSLEDSISSACLEYKQRHEK